MGQHRAALRAKRWRRREERRAQRQRLIKFMTGPIRSLFGYAAVGRSIFTVTPIPED